MKYLNFKGLLFDEFNDDYANGEDFQNIWVGMCESCAKRFGKKLGSDRMDNSGSGCCSVCGCDEEDLDFYGSADFYVDFDPSEVEILDITLDPGNDIDLTIEGLEVSIFWVRPSFNTGWYPVCQIDDGDLTVFHREGTENHKHWHDLVVDAFAFINECLREV